MGKIKGDLGAWCVCVFLMEHGLFTYFVVGLLSSHFRGERAQCTGENLKNTCKAVTHDKL